MINTTARDRLVRRRTGVSPVSANVARRSRGYVLIVVLFLIALAAVTVAGICRMSLEKAVRAGRAEADLQRRWTAISCQAVLLPRAEDLFLHTANAPSEVRRAIVLNGRPVTLVFGDEQAKANVNLLYAQAGTAATERELRTVVGASGGFIPVELRPIPGAGLSFGSADANDDDPRALESFDQLLPTASPAGLTNTRGRRWPLASRLTCWGDGSLNVRRAPDEAVRAVLARHLTGAEISRLLDARAKDAAATSADLLDALDLSAARRAPVEDLLTEQSFCHSLWVIIDSHQRVDYDLAVTEGAATTRFTW